MGKNEPTTSEGQENKSLRKSRVVGSRISLKSCTSDGTLTHRLMEKQKAQGTGRPVGPSTTHCIVTLELVDSKACFANASYRSTTEAVSSSCGGAAGR